MLGYFCFSKCRFLTSQYNCLLCGTAECGSHMLSRYGRLPRFKDVCAANMGRTSVNILSHGAERTRATHEAECIHLQVAILVNTQTHRRRGRDHLKPHYTLRRQQELLLEQKRFHIQYSITLIVYHTLSPSPSDCPGLPCCHPQPSLISAPRYVLPRKGVKCNHYISSCGEGSWILFFSLFALSVPLKH